MLVKLLALFILIENFIKIPTKHLFRIYEFVLERMMMLEHKKSERRLVSDKAFNIWAKIQQQSLKEIDVGQTYSRIEFVSEIQKLLQ